VYQKYTQQTGVHLTFHTEHRCWVGHSGILCRPGEINRTPAKIGVRRIGKEGGIRKITGVNSKAMYNEDINRSDREPEKVNEASPASGEKIAGQESGMLPGFGRAVFAQPFAESF
jgi:hypothetical protein